VGPVSTTIDFHGQNTAAGTGRPASWRWEVQINGSPWRSLDGRVRRFTSYEAASNAVKRHLSLATEPRP
jgi:hypothetical protein